MNASELAVLLPGVAGNLSDEGNVVGFTIRGMPPAMNTITIDGHDFTAIDSAISKAKTTKNGKPTIIIAKTTALRPMLEAARARDLAAEMSAQAAWAARGL
jgi:TPP-dependent pyruvate/acetoin dehydrogenase alpha subunit